MEPLTVAESSFLDKIMTKLLGRSWRTGIVGLLTMACAVAPFLPFLSPEAKQAASAITGILAGGGFMLTKDAKVSGLPKPR